MPGMGPTVGVSRSAAPATRGGSLLALIAWLVVSFSAAIAGSQFMPGAWYAGLAKPPWTPPNWVFAPAWSILYALMGIAAWLVWRRAGWREGARPLGLFLVQLVLNALWSYVVFGLHLLGAGVVEMALLWVAILATLVLFWRVSAVAGALLIPYLGWVSFAFCLNVAIWRMNA